MIHHLDKQQPSVDSVCAEVQLLILVGARFCFTQSAMAEPTREGLVRGIRRWDLAAITVNGIIGAGIFGLPKEVFARTGVYSLFAFAACTLVVVFIILCFAEVGSRFSETGGPYLYAREAFGPLVGFEVGWLIWIARLTAFAANCNLLVGYLSFFWPAAISSPWRAIIITSIIVLIALVNILGVRDAAIVTDFFTIGKLIPLVLFIAIGLFFIQPERYSLGPAPGYGEFSSSCLLLIYAFSGFEMAVIPAGEARDPRRNLPFALLTAVGLVAVVYMLIQTVCIGTLAEPGHVGSPARGLGDDVSRAAGGVIISVGALVSIFGNLNVILLAGSRLPFAMAERRELPQFIAMVHRRFRTPHLSILITAAVMLALTLSGTFVICRDDQCNCEVVHICRELCRPARAAAKGARPSGFVSRARGGCACGQRAGAMRVAPFQQLKRSAPRLGNRGSDRAACVHSLQATPEIESSLVVRKTLSYSLNNRGCPRTLDHHGNRR